MLQIARGIALASLLLVMSFATGAALAQSGSAGGSIGNDDKSLSGSREPSRAATPSASTGDRKQEAGSKARASQKVGSESGGGGGNFDGAWVVVAVGTPCGSSTERVVISSGRLAGEMTNGQVAPNGATTGHGAVSGLSWTSSGRFSGRSGSGSFVRSDGCTGRWTASKL